MVQLIFNSLAEIMFFIWLYALVGYDNSSMNIVIIYNRLANKCHDIIDYCIHTYIKQIY